jgi:acyl transferase domain-containing protein/NADPH:quinone reductase-like Zn-dependent oxidoreductase/acyl carrier protein
LENANIDPASLRHGNGGVYIGASSIDYALELESLPYEELDGHLASGITGFPMCGRLSYFFGMRGPSVVTDGACASSLTAMHMAVNGLRSGETDIALCGAVNSVHHPRILVMFSNGNMMAEDGRCKTFDESADGYARSEGCGVLVLKRLSDAERDGNEILALVRGTAIGQDGESAGLTVPNGTAQEIVIRTALANAGLTPADIQYVEAHGTGTPLGDPIEMGAITDVFGASHTKADPIVVGSVKTNVGHMEPAAGMVGMVKTILQMRAGTIFPHLNLTNPSGRIPWDSIPVVVPTECRAWAVETRRAVVNSFGFAGSIASVVLEEAPRPTPSGKSAVDRNGRGHVFTLSAKSGKALGLQVARYQEYLAADDAVNPVDVGNLCYTGNVARSHFNHRLAGVVRDRADLDRLLAKHLARPGTGPAVGDIRKVAFLFTGQGSQYAGMGAQLYRQYPVFRQHVDECDQLFAAHLGRSVAALVFGAVDDPDELQQTRYTQPALFTLEYALAKLWMSWGLRPNVVIGHSIGEVVAATVAGLFDLPDAVALVAARARLMQSVTSAGGMTAVTAPAEDVLPVLAGYGNLSLAAINSPAQCVISGGVRSLAAVTDALVARGIEVRPLPVSHAFHSPLMAEVFDAFRAALAGITFREPTMALISNVTGGVAKRAELSDPEYWVRHIGEPVNFEAGMRALERRGRHAIVEIGPSRSLSGLARQCVTTDDHLWVSSLHSSDEDGSVITAAAATLFTAGLPISWANFHEGNRHQLVALPTYAFDRKRHWLPLKGKRHGLGGTSGAGPATHPLLGSEVTTEEQTGEGVREFAVRLDPGSPAYLADHVVLGRIVFPGTGYLETLLALQDAVYGDTRRPIEDARILEPLFLSAEEVTELRTRLRPGPAGTALVEIASRTAGIERRHCTSVLGAWPEDGDELTAAGRALRVADADSGDPDDVFSEDEVYAACRAAGLDYGPEFRRIRGVTRHGANLAVGDLRGHQAGALEHLPPFVMDSAIHAFAALADDGNGYLPVRFGRLRLFKKTKSADLRVLLRTSPADAEGVDLDLDILVLEDGRPMVELRGLGLKRVADSTAAGHDGILHQTRWVKRSAAGHPPQEGRHLLVTHQPRSSSLVTQAAAAGVRVTFAETAAEIAAVLRDQPPTDVCWSWRPGPGGVTVDVLRAECAENYRDLLALVGVLGAEGFGRNQRLWLLTQRAQWLPGDEPGAGEHLAAASLWGFGHSLLNESPAYRTTMVDLGDATNHEPFLEELTAPSADEFQLAFRAGHRHVRRLVPVRPRGCSDDNFELVIGEYGQFSGIKQVPAHDVVPTGDEIQVDVHSAGVNFKDVLNALGMLKEFGEQSLGFEAAGTVLATGPDARFQVGDEVIVNYLGCWKKRLTVPSAMAVAKPANVTFTEAAGLGSVYVTAYYALHNLAGMRPGDKVLIHAAAGGVGQAAVALAKAAGAEVFATASPHKWPLLRAQGVEHLMSSRTLDFADEIDRITGGTGVDIVLNSLNKDFIPAGMRSLGVGGRFIEMGKVGAWTTSQVADHRPDVTYHNFDLSELPEDEMFALNTELMGIVVSLVAAGDLPPLRVSAYRVDEVEEALKVLSRGANIGKLVLSFTDEHAPAAREVEIRPDRSYLVTGGLGALGLLTAQKLVGLGARHIALLARRETPAADVAHLLDRVRASAEVTVHIGDVGEPADVGRVVAALRAGPHPIGGVVHSAGAIADAPVAAQTWESIETVLRAKVYGSWLLHEAVRSLPELDFFVGYSSAASVVGAPAQSNYAAGNAFLDQLMHWRAAQHLPGQSLNWGPWAEVGMSARLGEQLIRRWADEGVTLLGPAVGLRAFASLLARPLAQVLVGACDWRMFASARPVVNALYQEAMRDGGDAQLAFDLDALLAAPQRERAATIDEFVRAKVATVLHYDDADAVDSVTEFVRLGLDSLVAVELKNALESAFRMPLPASVAYDYPSAGLLAEFLDRQLVAGPVA